MRYIYLFFLLGLLLFSGCVERRITIASSPEGAEVFFDGNRIGLTPVTASFTYYGKHTILIRKEKYKTINGELFINSPMHQKPGLDFFSENLYPGTIKDSHSITFDLEPVEKSDTQEVLKRSELTKQEYENFMKSKGSK